MISGNLSFLKNEQPSNYANFIAQRRTKLSEDDTRSEKQSLTLIKPIAAAIAQNKAQARLPRDSLQQNAPTRLNQPVARSLKIM